MKLDQAERQKEQYKRAEEITKSISSILLERLKSAVDNNMEQDLNYIADDEFAIYIGGTHSGYIGFLHGMASEAHTGVIVKEYNRIMRSEYDYECDYGRIEEIALKMCGKLIEESEKKAKVNKYNG